MYRQQKEDQRRVNKTIFERTEPFFRAVRPILVRLKAAYQRRDLDWPSSSNSYSIHLNRFNELVKGVDEDGTLNSISKNALQICEMLREAVRRYEEDLNKMENTESWRVYLEDKELLALIEKAISEIDVWMDNWQKWA